MAYIAMARKWRPERFSDMVGQDHIARTLESAVRENRLHHGYLFTGTRGVGKTTSARILAKMLNCLQENEFLPCNICSSCKEIASGHSMDVIEIDGASNNKVEHVRDLIEQVKYAPMNGKYKIFIIDEVHMLTTSAFNALLKTLEEPPAHVVFIFATTESHKVPQTILSRIQRYDFKRIGPKQIAERLQHICEQENLTTTPTALNLIAEQGDGSMRDALTLFDQVYAFSGSDISEESARQVLGIPGSDLYFALMEHIAAHNQKGCFAVVEEFFQKGIEIHIFLDGFGKFLRNILLGRIDSEALSQEVTPHSLQRYLDAGSPFKSGDLLRLSRMLSDMQSGLKNSSQPRIAVEMGLARMAYLDRIANFRKILSHSPIPDDQKKK
jgi:DNA polymerase III subunit gamma/tau